MAYLKNYQYDIFLSYAHVDNATINDQTKGWVSAFYEELKLLVDQKLGRLGITDMWWDKNLRKNHYFNNEISDSIKNSALFVAFTSSGYMASDYCQKELSSFFTHNANNFMVENMSRIYNVSLNSIHYSQWPTPYEGMTTYEMFKVVNKSRDPLGFPVEPGSNEFRNCLRELAGDIYAVLLELKKKDTQPPAPPLPGSSIINGQGSGATQQDDQKFKVFMAKATPGKASEQEQIIKALQIRNIQVIHGVPPPYTKKEHEYKIREKVKEVDLSIHLFDGGPGDLIEENSTVTFQQEQVEIVREMKKEQLIFLPREFAFDSSSIHSVLLKGLEENKKESDKYSLVRQSATDYIVGDILLKLKETGKQVDRKVAPAVFLDFHEKDSAYAVSISNFLEDRNIKTYMCMTGTDPIRNIEKFEATMKKVTSIMIIYGTVVREWVNERINKAIATIFSEHCPVSHFAIYLAPHANSSVFPIHQKVVNIEWLDDSTSAEFNPNTVDSFIQKI